MPNTQNGFLGIPQPQRAPDGGGFRGFARRLGAGFVRGAVPDNAAQGVTGALGGPATVVGRGIGNAIREGVGGSSWFNNLQDSARNLFTRRDRNESGSNGSSSLPTFMQRQSSGSPPSSAPAVYGPPSNLSSYNHMPDPNTGPPGPPPVRAFPLPVTAPAMTRGQRMGNGVMATGDAAVNMARGFAGTGLGGGAGGGGGASSYGRDQLNSQWREA
jgi:hypothetical protein